jgi:hypothetical protein
VSSRVTFDGLPLASATAAGSAFTDAVRGAIATALGVSPTKVEIISVTAAGSSSSRRVRLLQAGSSVVVDFRVTTDSSQSTNVMGAVTSLGSSSGAALRTNIAQAAAVSAGVAPGSVTAAVAVPVLTMTALSDTKSAAPADSPSMTAVIGGAAGGGAALLLIGAVAYFVLKGRKNSFPAQPQPVAASVNDVAFENTLRKSADATDKAASFALENPLRKAAYTPRKVLNSVAVNEEDDEVKVVKVTRAAARVSMAPSTVRGAPPAPSPPAPPPAMPA